MSSQPEQPQNSSVQPDERGASAAPDEEDDPFWGLDDIPCISYYAYHFSIDLHYIVLP